MKRVPLARRVMCALVLMPTVAAASVHPKTTAHASSCLYGDLVNGTCPHTNYLKDAILDSPAWISRRCLDPNGNCLEWFAFWFGSNLLTDYVRLMPSIYGASHEQVVPPAIEIYYVGPTGGWTHATTVSLPARLPRSGEVIYFPTPVLANGILIRAPRQGANSSGAFYMQMAETYAGYSGLPSQTLPVSNGVTCDIYGDSPRRVLTNDDENLAYDFNVTEYGPSSYIAVFHSEAFGQSAGSAGDSTAVRYGTSPDGLFATRTGPDAGDHVVTRIANNWNYMYGGSAGPIGQGGNPILVRHATSGDFQWSLLYLTVSDWGDAPGWRHYLMLGQPYNVLQMHNTTWTSLANQGSGQVAQDYWHWFCAPWIACGSIGKDPSGNLRSYNPFPVRNWQTSKTVSSIYQGPSADNTTGLMGNISYNATLDKAYLFHIDFDGSGKTFRQESLGPTYLNWWGNPVVALNGWAQKVAYHATRQRWAVIAQCTGGDGKRDLCLQFTQSDAVGGLTDINPVNLAYKLGLSQYFRDASIQQGVLTDVGIMEQYGILKNARGQIAGDTFYVYVTERTLYGAAGGLYGMDMSAVRVTCH